MSTQQAEPDTAEYRARTLLALALISHRATAEGMTARDVADLQAALTGLYDERTTG
jgi:hypothetical protein